MVHESFNKKPKTRVTVAVPADLASDFDCWAREIKGYIKERAAAAAFRLLMAIPPELREKLMEGDTIAVFCWFDEAQAALLQRRAADALKHARKSPSTARSARRKKGGENSSAA